jgi:hypothetical protein
MSKRLERLETSVLLSTVDQPRQAKRISNLMNTLHVPHDGDEVMAFKLRMIATISDKNSEIATSIREIVNSANIEFQGSKVTIIFSASFSEYAEIQKRLYELPGLQPDRSL